MSTLIMERAELHQAIDRLPDEALDDVASFVKNLVWQYQREEGERPFEPVNLPKGIAKDTDITIEEIRQMRREVWANFPREF
ncbi:MAG: hypothetical protein GY759_19085 [Chloroflexi bacterium]|nr:hypothetical protein [Chloroflexota bacterium]